ncbi:MAG: O-antigen ligase family protein [Anaerolineae bacterium]|nr:O-antigen ligase family protein [Anaerolineae bacterium]
MIAKAWRVSQSLLWGAIFLVLPVSSMPLVVRLVHSDTVAAPAGLFLLLFILVWFVPYIFMGGRLPGVVRIFLAFCLAAVFATFLSVFLEIPPFKGISISLNALNALLTLAVGIGFYLTTATWVDEPGKLKFTFKLINWAGAAIVAWSALQAIYWARDNRYPEWMKTVHDLYSVGPLFRQRVSGFALEPSWLAHQLNMLYLPYWLAATVKRHSVHRFRLLGLSFENVLLLAGAVILWLSLSRVGLLGFLGMLAFLLVWVNLRAIHWARANIMRRYEGRFTQSKLAARVIMSSIVIVFLVGYLLLVLGVGYGLSQVDPRMRALFEFDLSRPDAVIYYAERLTFASRLVYWQAGMGVFDDHPWFGVGLGNAGFYFPQTLPAYAWKLVEVRDLMYRSDVLLNIKSLWVRLLAETGIIGFSLFIGWLYHIARQAILTWRQADKSLSTLGLMGIFVLIGLLFEAFSIDSFGLPYIWVALGLVSSGGWIMLKSNS